MKFAITYKPGNEHSTIEKKKGGPKGKDRGAEQAAFHRSNLPRQRSPIGPRLAPDPGDAKKRTASMIPRSFLLPGPPPASHECAWVSVVLPPTDASIGPSSRAWITEGGRTSSNSHWMSMGRDLRVLSESRPPVVAERDDPTDESSTVSRHCRSTFRGGTPS
jgi:hypothetical protein